MNNNRLIFIIALVISLVFNLPRINFLFGNSDQILSSLLEVSLKDTIFRVCMLFGFSYVVLKFNLHWLQKFNPKHHLTAAILVNALILIVWVLFFWLINQWIYSINDYSIDPRINKFVYAFVMLMLLIISRSIKLQNQSKLDAIEKERLKRESLQNELAALKNQINPHFLFNSLNSLSLLVREDQKAAGKFINKLSFLYRYILQSKDQDLVSIKEELKFLESYIHLIKERYRDNFNASINIDAQLLQRKIPTLALQLLMENAVKHNEISDNKRLHVDVYASEDWLVVKNKLQPRTGQVESTHTGLSNLNTRFKLHMNKEIVIIKDDTYFTVKIPIL